MYWSIDNQNSACDHRNIKLDYLHLGSDLNMIARRWIDCIFYYYIYLPNSRSIVWWSFENCNFFRQILKLYSIVEVNRLLATWKKVNRLMLSMWYDFWGWSKQFSGWKSSKNKVLQFLYKKWTSVGNTKEKKAILIWNWAKTK